MTKKIKILLLEDLSVDVELIHREIKKLDLDTELKVVQDEESFREALLKFKPDLILSDYMLPRFTGLEALKIAQSFDEHLPFIIVTGSMNEQTAVECMKAGAWDYIIKEKLERLIPAVKSALEKKEIIKEKQDAIRSLEESEERFRRLVELAPIAIVVHKKAAITYANPAAIKKSGFNSLDEMIGQNIFNFIHPDYLPIIKARYEALLKGEVFSPIAIKLLTRDKQEMDVELTSLPLGPSYNVMTLIDDLTEQKRLEAQYQGLIEQSSDAIFFFYKGRLELVNKAFVDMFGYTKKECLSNDFDFFKIVSEEHRDGLSERFYLLEKGESKLGLYEFHSYKKNGEKIICEASISSVPYKRGMAIQGIIRDISERRQVEENIRKLSQVIEQSPTAVIVTDVKGKIEYVNPAFTKITGYTFDEVKGRNPRFLQSGKVSRKSYRQLWKTIYSGKVWHGEFCNRKKDGSLYWAQIIISPIFDSKGRITHFMGIQDDITEKRQLENKFQQAQKMEAIGRLAGGVAHDFNNMLSVILGYGEIMLSKVHPKDPLRQYIDQIMEAAKRSKSLTSQLLAFSRRQSLKPEIVNLNEVIINLKKMLERLISENIELQLDLEKHLAQVKVDPTQIEQVIMNLVVNARDAMPNGGKLVIKTRNIKFPQTEELLPEQKNLNDYVMMSVQDSGVGMDELTLSQIFEPFFTTKPQDKGTGLGLASVYGIVKQLKGEIKVDSQVGKGTTFKVFFPATGGKKQAREQTLKELSVDKGKGEKILIVEDEQILRDMLKEILTIQGYDVITAANGGEAILLIEEKGIVPDLFITDIVMPGMSGVELVERIKRRHPDLKVLFMSGYAEKIISNENSLIREMPFISKPFDLKDITSKVKKLLK